MAENCEQNILCATVNSLDKYSRGAMSREMGEMDDAYMSMTRQKTEKLNMPQE